MDKIIQKVERFVNNTDKLNKWEIKMLAKSLKKVGKIKSKHEEKEEEKEEIKKNYNTYSGDLCKKLKKCDSSVSYQVLKFKSIKDKVLKYMIKYDKTFR